MKTLFTIAVAFTAFALRAQPAIQWQKSLGGSYYDYSECVAYTTDGTYVVAGEAASSDGDITDAMGGTDGWLVKLDHDGGIIFQKSYGGSASDYIYAIKNIPSGYVMAGYTASTDHDLSGNNGLNDCWVVKTDMDGNVIWSRNYGGSNEDFAYDISPTSDGGFIVAALTLSNNFDVTGHISQEDFWIFKLDADGNIVWENCYGGNKTDIPFAIIQLSDGNYLAAGYTLSYTGDITDHISMEDCVLMKIDPAGNLIWSHCYGGTKNESVRDVIENQSGHYVFIGSTTSHDGDITFNHGFYPTDADIWTVETDTAGNLVQEKCFGSASSDLGETVRQNPDGSYFIFGTAYEASGDVETVYGGNDYWLLRADPSLNILWENVYGGTSFDIGRGMDITNDNACIITGKSQSYNFDVTDPKGSDDYWVVKLLGDYIIMPSEINICSGDSALVNGNYETAAGIYLDTLISAEFGYDSILQTTLNVYPVPDIEFLTDADTVCIDSGLVLLNALPAGGIFSGAGVTGSEFDPMVAGIGDHAIEYQFTTVNGCIKTDSIIIDVTDCSPVFVTDSLFTGICTGDSIYLQNAWQNTSGIYFDTLTAVGGYDSILITTLDVYITPAVSLNVPVEFVCVDDPAFVLTGGSPSGGFYSGDGVIAGVFDPAAAVWGDNIIYYFYSDINNCAAIAVDTIVMEVCDEIHQTEPLSVNIFPNPSGGNISIKGFLNTENGTINIYNSTGELIISKLITKGTDQMDIRIPDPGLYLITYSNGNFISSGKVVIY